MLQPYREMNSGTMDGYFIIILPYDSIRLQSPYNVHNANLAGAISRHLQKKNLAKGT